jgi:hypothetical protein
MVAAREEPAADADHANNREAQPEHTAENHATAKYGRNGSTSNKLLSHRGVLR